MASKLLPTPETLRQLLRYEPETGRLFWRERGQEWFKGSANFSRETNCQTWNKRYSGSETFTRICRNGYLLGTIFNAKFLAHRVAWAVHHGAWPDGEIDHANGIENDNRISNLRLATRNQNLTNRKVRSTSVTGLKGVSFHKQRGRYRAEITVAGKGVHLGLFDSAEDAAEAYRQASAKYHGKFAVHHRP